ncbi:hypothetical protein ACFXTN_009041 [Malus domestica]
MVLQSTLQWQRKPKCYAIALRKPAAITQAVSCTTRRRHYQERTVTKRHYATRPRCRLLHSTTRQRATEESRDQKALHSKVLLQALAQLHTTAHHREKKTVNKRHYTAKPRCSLWWHKH